jgi:DNA (cytosine-5)-methyltransferase 1
VEVDGICYVQHLVNPEEIEQWVDHNNHFYLNQKRDDKGPLVDMLAEELKICASCFDNRLEKLQRQNELRAKNDPLRCLELFSGMCFGRSKDHILIIVHLH